jgi:dTDP-4-dehydrorhamnose reductase
MERMPSRALVLGATGMLGSTLLREFRARGIDTIATARRPGSVEPGSEIRRFDVETDDVDQALDGMTDGDYVVNCIGVIRHLMRDDLAADRLRAIEVNASFPYRLATAADARGLRILQIATDCVYSGATGRYDESAAHDATDVYGQTKSLGEVPGNHVLNLRCSIIGPEMGSTTSLLEWVLAHPHGATVGGYIDHHWNGVTTLAFARVASGIVVAGDPLAGTRHLVPADSVSKAELVRLIARAWGRDDLDIREVSTSRPIDRTLDTLDPELSRRLWRQGGYPEPPSIADMVAELAAVRA